jgi:hypothetical protein
VWDVEHTEELGAWWEDLEPDAQERLTAAVELLEELGPSLGRPLADTQKGSRHPNMKELRPGMVRALFASGPRRTAILLLGGDKSGHWKDRYVGAIPEADRLFDDHLKGLIDEEG